MMPAATPCVITSGPRNRGSCTCWSAGRCTVPLLLPVMNLISFPRKRQWDSILRLASKWIILPACHSRPPINQSTCRAVESPVKQTPTRGLHACRGIGEERPQQQQRVEDSGRKAGSDTRCCLNSGSHTITETVARSLSLPGFYDCMLST